MHVLLTNDDGIHAEGLAVLCRRFARRHTVTVVAPDSECSAIGHAITLRVPLRAEAAALPDTAASWAVSGTPADCVKLALKQLLERPPDLVVSGINPGANVGANVNYSGTVAAAREAALAGLPAIAVSIQGRYPRHYESAALFVRQLAEEVRHRGLPGGTFLSVNFPDIRDCKVGGVAASRQSTSLAAEHIDKRHDPYERPYYWQYYRLPPRAEEAGTDTHAVFGQQVSITPLKCDTTDYETIEILKHWELGSFCG